MGQTLRVPPLAESEDSGAERLRLACVCVLGITPFYMNGWYNPHIASSRPLFWAVEVFTWIILPVAVCAYGWSTRLFSNRTLGLSTEVCGRQRPFVLCLLLVVAPIMMLWIDGLLLRAAVDLFPHNYGAIAFSYRNVLPLPGPETGAYRLLAVAYLSLSAGIVEEFYYRAVLKRVFARGLVQSALYVVVSSALFAGAHWEGGVQKVLYCLLWGLICAIAYMFTGNLWPLVVGHIAVDLFWLASRC